MLKSFLLVFLALPPIVNPPGSALLLLEVGIRGGVPAALMAPGLLFASSYFSVITPQGGSQNIIFAAAGYLKQGELYRLGLLITIAFMAIYLVIGTSWLLFISK